MKIRDTMLDHVRYSGSFRDTVDAKDDQLAGHVERLGLREVDREGHVQPAQVDLLHANAYSTRQQQKDDYIIGLYNKHGAIPAPYKPASAPIKVHNPLKRETLYNTVNPEGPLIKPQFDSYQGGNDPDERIRKRFNKAGGNSRLIHDGRFTDKNGHVESMSTGVNVPHRQGSYEAQHSLDLMGKAARREVEALMDIKGTTTTYAKSMAFEWQGPGAYATTAGDNTRIPRRQTKHVERSLVLPDGTGSLFQKYEAPDHVTSRVVRKTHLNTRHEITGGVTKQEMPQIGGFVDIVSRPRVMSMDHYIHAPTDTSSYIMDPTVAIGRGDSFKTTNRPIWNTGPQKPIPGVAGNRAMHQAHTGVSSEVNRQLNQERYTAEYEGKHQYATDPYQRGHTHDTLFNKLIAFPPHEQMRVERDFAVPLDHNVQRRILN